MSDCVATADYVAGVNTCRSASTSDGIRQALLSLPQLWLRLCPFSSIPPIKRVVVGVGAGVAAVAARLYSRLLATLRTTT